MVCSMPAWAQRAFPLSWDSATQRPGSHEVQSWLTERVGREDTGYTQLDVRFQAAQGVTDHLDAMVGFDVDLASFGLDSCAVEARVSTTWRYALMRSTEVVGLALVSRGAAGVDSGELELRLVIDKQFGPLWLALNGSATRTHRWASVAGINARFEQSFGARYQVQEALAAGLEVRARQAWARTTYQGTAFSAGPTLTYTSKRWWFTLGLLVQAGADKAKADRGNREPLEVRDNERFVGRLVLGVKTD